VENNARKLSVFVDESGSFLYPDRDSRFYIIGMVFHDQSVDIGPQLKEMDRAIEDIEMSRREFAEGKGIPSDEVFREMDELIKVWANEKRSVS
jgi:hypothetical protein